MERGRTAQRNTESQPLCANMPTLQRICLAGCTIEIWGQRRFADASITQTMVEYAIGDILSPRMSCVFAVGDEKRCSGKIREGKKVGRKRARRGKPL